MKVRPADSKDLLLHQVAQFSQCVLRVLKKRGI